MASEDSCKHLVERPKPSSPLALWVHCVHLPEIISARPSSLRCSLRCIISRISRKRMNVSRLQLNGTTYRSKNGIDALPKDLSRRRSRTSETRGLPDFGEIRPLTEGRLRQLQDRAGRFRADTGRILDRRSSRDRHVGCRLMLTQTDPSPSMKPARNQFAASVLPSLSC